MSLSILLQGLSCGFSGAICFEHFTTHILQGAHIALIGRNGSGKSTLLKMLAGHMPFLTGYIEAPDAMVIRYVSPYKPLDEQALAVSGGEAAYGVLSRAFQEQPDVLLLDEPTTHLDRSHRQALLRMIKRFSGVLIVATHDVELLTHFDNVWSIENKQVICFQGGYEAYVEQRRQHLNQIEHTLHHLKKVQEKNHESLMREQQRASKSRSQGKKHIEKKKWPIIRSQAKVNRAVTTSHDKTTQLRQQRLEIHKQREQLKMPEILRPTFSLKVNQLEKGPIITVSNGSVGYGAPILEEIYLQLAIGERVALVGNNGSGKSTLLKACLSDPEVRCLGEWHLPAKQHIGYIDQHQSMLRPDQTVYEAMREFMPHSTQDAIRIHLSHFLFRSHLHVDKQIGYLSSGERTRLCLAKIAADTPPLLLLDEVTNALDLETRQQVIDVLKDYPGALIVISHDEPFLRDSACKRRLVCEKGRVSQV